MIAPTLLGAYKNCHDLLLSLFEQVPAADASVQFHPDLGSLSYYLGKCVYRETFWIREHIAADDDLTKRVAHLFSNDSALSLQQRCQQLPPTDHLLNWAMEVLDGNLMRLANPGSLPDAPLMQEDRLLHYLVQEHCRQYELMLAVLNFRQLQSSALLEEDSNPLQPAMPTTETAMLDQGHYLIGARDNITAYDNELPPQSVQLSRCRILRRPVSNAQYLSFMQDGGYSNDSLWTDAGTAWRRTGGAEAPAFWRQSSSGNWFGVGINGVSSLAADAPVSGVSQYEAAAFARWIADKDTSFSGAALPHEYQSETGHRLKLLEQTGETWEWSSLPSVTYDAYQPWPDESAARKLNQGDYITLKGGCLHTQPVLRRPSFRLFAQPGDRCHFSGFRLILPAE